MTPHSSSNLHDLFDAATADLAPLPDLAPVARRLAHRRRLTERSLIGGLAAALVIGAGTLALEAPWASHGSNPIGAASGQSLFKAQAAALLTRIWPTQGVRIEPAAQPMAGGVTKPTAGTSEFELVAPDGKGYQLFLGLDRYPSDLPVHNYEVVRSGVVYATPPSNSAADENMGAHLTYIDGPVRLDMDIVAIPLTLIDDAHMKALLANPQLADLVSMGEADGVVQINTQATPTPSVPGASSPTPSVNPSEPEFSSPTPSEPGGSSPTPSEPGGSSPTPSEPGGSSPTPSRPAMASPTPSY